MPRFTATAEPRKGGGVSLQLPFDPDRQWGARDRHDITGTVGACKVRGRLIERKGAYYLELGPAWQRDNRLVVGSQVEVELAPEGPQIDAMAPDLAAAFEAEPAARRFFESLPTFYRKNFMRSIDGAKRPETRAKRIQTMLDALKAGRRE